MVHKWLPKVVGESVKLIQNYPEVTKDICHVGEFGVIEDEFTVDLSIFLASQNQSSS